MNFDDNSKNNNRKMDFSFDSAHCTSFMKVGSKLRVGVRKSLVGTGPRYRTKILIASIEDLNEDFVKI